MLERAKAAGVQAVLAIGSGGSGPDRLDAAIGKAPKNYRKLVRLGVNGATIPYYLCQFGLRGTDLQGKTVRANIFRSDAGRCTEP